MLAHHHDILALQIGECNHTFSNGIRRSLGASLGGTRGDCQKPLFSCPNDKSRKCSHMQFLCFGRNNLLHVASSFCRSGTIPNSLLLNQCCSILPTVRSLLFDIARAFLPFVLFLSFVPQKNHLGYKNRNRQNARVSRIFSKIR